MEIAIFVGLLVSSSLSAGCAGYLIGRRERSGVAGKATAPTFSRRVERHIAETAAKRKPTVITDAKAAELEREEEKRHRL